MALTYDIGLTPSGDLPLYGRFIAGEDLVAQRLQNRLATHLGEWWLDTAEGVPWVEWLQQRPPQVEAMAARLRRECLTTEGVESVVELTGTYTASTSTISFSGSVLAGGTMIEVSATPLSAGQYNPNPIYTRIVGGAVRGAVSGGIAGRA